MKLLASHARTLVSHSHTYTNPASNGSSIWMPKTECVMLTFRHLAHYSNGMLYFYDFKLRQNQFWKIILRAPLSTFVDHKNGLIVYTRWMARIIRFLIRFSFCAASHSIFDQILATACCRRRRVCVCCAVLCLMSCVLCAVRHLVHWVKKMENRYTKNGARGGEREKKVNEKLINVVLNGLFWTHHPQFNSHENSRPPRCVYRNHGQMLPNHTLGLNVCKFFRR